MLDFIFEHPIFIVSMLNNEINTSRQTLYNLLNKMQENGIPLETAAKMLGHSLLKSTLSVTCFTENKIANDMSAISGQFKDMETMFNL